ncbi:MAG: NADH-quinone oxidoreductase subunit N [Euryarchaeota archaeon]|nr:NADH-quinone oxidoreductase subunit N [Euryarchaeota archaeon]
MTRKPSTLWAIALVGLLASTFVTLDMMGLSWSRLLGLNLWPVPGLGDSGALTGGSAGVPDLKLDVDLFALLFNFVFLLVALLSVIGSKSYVKREEPNQAEYYALLLLAVVGMMLVAAATDLLVLYLAFELASLSTFALVAFRKRDKRATEASLKFFVIGAVSSAIILFGVSLIYVIAGTLDPAGTDFTGLEGIKQMVTSARLTQAGMEPPFIVAVIFLFAGFGFKVATVPFHMWAPDVYEGSPTTISTFLAAGSKKVGVAAMFKVFLVALLAVQVDWLLAMAALAIATQTVGNVFAIPQRNIKRMLAYSSIAQAGYILIAIIVAGLAVHSNDPRSLDVASYGLAGGLFHVLTHALMKGGAFLVVAAAAVLFIGEDIDGWKGLGKRSPFLALAMTVFLLSLAGIPPFGGFFSKFVLFSGAVFASDPAIPGGSPWFLWLAVAGVLNSALSLYYYARVIRYMYILEPTDMRKLEAPTSMNIAIALALIGIVLTGIVAEPLIGYLQDASRGFLTP